MTFFEFIQFAFRSPLAGATTMVIAFAIILAARNAFLMLFGVYTPPWDRKVKACSKCMPTLDDKEAEMDR